MKESSFNMAIADVYIEKTDDVFDTLENAESHSKSLKIVIIIKEAKRKIGREKIFRKRHKIGIRNVREEKWVQCCTANREVATNSWFKEYPRYLLNSKSAEDIESNTLLDHQ